MATNLAQPTGVTTKTKRTIWKYLGSMIMEPKGPAGQLGMSFHKTLGLGMMGWALVMWTPQSWTTGQLPDMAVYTLWALLGLKAVSKVAENVGKK